MIAPIYLIALPFLSFVGLFFAGSYFSRKVLQILSSVGIVLSAILSLGLLFGFSNPYELTQNLFTWIPALGAFEAINFSLRLDSLSLNMCLVVTFVSSWIVIYALEYMAKETGVVRFFAAVNLFVAFMLLLVLADNLLLMFIGWEGVGLCSYILIGFYYKEAGAQKAALKAFLTTRIGDVFLLLGIVICFLVFKTLDIKKISEIAPLLYPQGSFLITLACFGFLGGAVGKSAQLPLQTWLADAMWGPTPVSALIHAATMVTAGVYLIARLSVLFVLSPMAQEIVLLIGAITLVFAGIIAVLQTDMKKVLAYSTMSQLGYMFLALGAGAFDAAIFHLTTHAFFKALLFLAAGVIGHSLHTYELKKMGGLRKTNSALFWLFLIGCLNLMGLPFVTAGFFSKELILSQVHHNPYHHWAWIMGVIGAGLTGLYTTKMLLQAFFGKSLASTKIHAGIKMMLPLYVLAFFSLILGGLHGDILLENFGHESLFVFFGPTIAAFLGAILAICHVKFNALSSLKNGGGFESLYENLFIKPYCWLSEYSKSDLVLKLEAFFGFFLNGLFMGIKNLHTGSFSSYISFLVMAALVMAGVMVI